MNCTITWDHVAHSLNMLDAVFHENLFFPLCISGLSTKSAPVILIRIQNLFLYSYKQLFYLIDWVDILSIWLFFQQWCQIQMLPHISSQVVWSHDYPSSTEQCHDWSLLLSYFNEALSTGWWDIESLALAIDQGSQLEGQMLTHTHIPHHRAICLNVWLQTSNGCYLVLLLLSAASLHCKPIPVLLGNLITISIKHQEFHHLLCCHICGQHWTCCHALTAFPLLPLGEAGVALPFTSF